MSQSRSERASARQGAAPLRATRRMLGNGLCVAPATQFAIGRSTLAATRIGTRRPPVPLRTVATGDEARASRQDIRPDRDAGSNAESPDRSAPGNAGNAAFDAFLETCVPLDHPPHE